MAYLQRALSILLLAIGLAVIFAGLTGAVGSTPLGIVSSAAAVAALLYAGAIWFGSGPPSEKRAAGSPMLFDRDLRVVAGERHGARLTDALPVGVRPEVEARCRAALDGQAARFACPNGRSHIEFEAVPVRAADGVIVYGLLIMPVKSTASSPHSASV